MPIREAQSLSDQSVLKQLWALGFIRSTLYDGRTFRALNVIHKGNREALRIEFGRSIPATCLVRVMKELIEAYGKLTAIRLDNGPEMTTEAFVQWPLRAGVIEQSAAGDVTDGLTGKSTN